MPDYDDGTFGTDISGYDDYDDGLFGTPGSFSIDLGGWLANVAYQVNRWLGIQIQRF
jgi:hypothetical protein